MGNQTLGIAKRFQNWPCRSSIDPFAGLFHVLSKMYYDREFLPNNGPSAVLWFDETAYCLDARWSVSAVPWKGSKENRAWQCLTWLPEMAGKALHTAILKTLKDGQSRETVLFLDTVGITFEYHFWIVPTKLHRVMAIMRQCPFQQI